MRTGAELLYNLIARGIDRLQLEKDLRIGDNFTKKYSHISGRINRYKVGRYLKQSCFCATLLVVLGGYNVRVG